MKRSHIAGRHSDQVEAAETLLGPRVESTWFAVGAAVVGAVGTLYASNQQAKAQEYNAEVSEKNAMVARSEGSAREDAMRAHQRQVIGQQLAATSASGVNLSGSGLDILNDSLYKSSIDNMNIRYESEVKARGQTDQAALDRFGASSTRTGGYLSAAGKLIGGSASYFGQNTIPSYNYNGDASGDLYSRTGADILNRR